MLDRMLVVLQAPGFTELWAPGATVHHDLPHRDTPMLPHMLGSNSLTAVEGSNGLLAWPCTVGSCHP